MKRKMEMEMGMGEILKKLCKEGAGSFSEPFTQGDHTYATDGRILIRVPIIVGLLMGIRL